MVTTTTKNEQFAKPKIDTSGGLDYTQVDDLLKRDYVQGTEIVPVRIMAGAGGSATETIITDGTDDLIINTDGSLNTKPILLTKTFKSYCDFNTATKYTVPANKVFWCTGYSIATQVPVNGDYGIINFFDTDGTTLLAKFGYGIVTNLCASGPISQFAPFKLTEGQIVKFVSGTGATFMTFWGYEEDE